jgi:hypothetical protein
MIRVNTKIGDIFLVKVDNNTKKYFQLIAFDVTQLNSDVIRAFKTSYPLDITPELYVIVNDEVEFYAHCVTKAGLKMGLWEKVGNIANIGKTDNIVFRDSSDYGKPEIKISENWWIWKINEEQKYVGKLEGANKEADIGVVIAPIYIADRIRTGKYNFKYPDYE